MRKALRLGRLEVENLALSSRAGEMTLSVPGAHSSPAGTLEAGLVTGAHASYLVRVTTLDEHFGDGAPVRLIKCDVEGHELEVFRGGEALLKAHRPILVFECEERHHRRHTSQDVFAFLEGLGYEGGFFARGGLRPLREFDPAVHGDPECSGYANNFAFQPRALAASP
jgi:FkbM family methyltransferase